MESIEIWMWLVAGMMLGSIIFVSAFSFLSNYTKNVEISQAEESFDMLRDTMDTVCLGGPYSQEVKTLIFPYSVSDIYIQDEHSIKGQGNNLCIEIFGVPQKCNKLSICSTVMGSIDLQTKTDVFYLVQKALGKRRPASIRFKISKVDNTMLNTTWTRVLD